MQREREFRCRTGGNSAVNQGIEMRSTNKANFAQRLRRCAVVLLLLPLLGVGDSDAQTAKTTKYKYDALGRLTYVEDGVNGNRDYDYDKAGNRRNVAVGTANDGASEPGPLPPPPPPPPPTVPAAPTGLGMTHVADCAWSGYWSASGGATSYIVRDTNGTEQTVPGTSATVSCPIGDPQSNKPRWVKACSSAGCSAQASF
jgi:hypothetical protein